VLYASTAPPIVWKRSTGLEVLNELDAFKPGIQGAAGGESSTLRSPRFLWDTAARDVEMVIGETQVAQSVGSGLMSAARRVLQQLATAVSWPGTDRKI
jgi:ubiquinone biosynthesis monooxygenase Coq6